MGKFPLLIAFIICQLYDNWVKKPNGIALI